MVELVQIRAMIVAAMSNILLATSFLKNRWKGLKIWSATSSRVDAMYLLRFKGIISFSL
jgi:hypothetical protein